VRGYRDLPSKPRVILWKNLAPLYPGQTFYGSRRVDEINEAIGKVADLEGVETVDMEFPLKGRPEWFPDHLHPNAEGAKAIAKVMKDYLSPKK
jgi:lysophospholipase L1-like esterase